MQARSLNLNLWLPALLVVLLAVALGSWIRFHQTTTDTAAAQREYTNSLGMAFVYIPGGRFQMGTSMGAANEQPAHDVDIAPFYLGKYEVTQAEWQAVMGSNPSVYRNPRRPVEQVSWYAAQMFLQRLNQREGVARYRLPSEAEWEYAARAGGGGTWFFGEAAELLPHYAWIGRSVDQGTAPVGRKQPNPWGLYDLYGNVWEWVLDCWHEDYRQAPALGYPWPGGDCSRRMLRGGAWHSSAPYARSALRGSADPGLLDAATGLRIAFSSPK